MDNRNTLEVHNYTRRLDYATPPMDYVCLVWPRQRTAYELGTATFRYPVSSLRAPIVCRMKLTKFPACPRSYADPQLRLQLS
jgi:hypothetical protein